MRFETEKRQYNWGREYLGYFLAYFIFVCIVSLIVKIFNLNINIFMVALITAVFLLIGNFFRRVAK
jgi:hypothetical protein